MSRVAWMTFSKLRCDAEPRSWMRRSEFLKLIRGETPGLGIHHIRRAVRGMPFERHYGHKHYTTEHLEAVRAYAAAHGLTMKGVE